MNTVKHSEIRRDECIIDELRVDVLNESAYTILKYAEGMGGFIAGGFAAKYAAARLIYNNTKHPSSILERYISNAYASTFDQFYNAYKVTHKRDNGDIDVYFPTAEAATAFMTRCLVKCSNSNNKIRVEESAAHCGLNIYCTGVHGVQMIQTITKYVGTPEQIVETFDIYNACCVIKRKSLFIPDKFEELSNNCQVRVQSWAHPWTLKRVSKWMYKHHLERGLTSDSLDAFNDHIKEVLKTVEAGEVKQFDKVIKPYEFIKCRIEPLIKHVSPENLLLLSLYYNRPTKHSYSASMDGLIENVPMNELNQRLAEGLKKSHP